MEQDTVVTAPKFDEAMMEEYDEDAVGDEFLEELTEKKVATPPKNINKQLVENKQVKKSKAASKQTEEKKAVDLLQRKKQLWGTEEDGGWYASSAKIVSRSHFDSNSCFCF